MTEHARPRGPPNIRMGRISKTSMVKVRRARILNAKTPGTAQLIVGVFHQRGVTVSHSHSLAPALKAGDFLPCSASPDACVFHCRVVSYQNNHVPFPRQT